MHCRKVVIVALAALLSSAGVGVAQNGNQGKTPGHLMQEKGSKKGEPGASGYAPGHLMQEKGSKKGSPGASGYAPGHSPTTGQGDRH